MKDQLKKSISFDGDFLLSARNVAIALGYKNPNDAILRHIDVEDKVLIRNSMIDDRYTGIKKINNAGEIFVNESGLYSLILKSDLRSAKKFKKWITSEVLPQVRKTGSYNANQVAIIDEEKIKLIIEKLSLEYMINNKTDKVKETIKYLRAYGLTKAVATDLTLKAMKFNMSAEKILEDYMKQQKEIKALAYTGKIKLAIADLVKLGYTQKDAWNKFGELASKSTGIDVKAIKNNAFKQNIKATYCSIVADYNIQKESLTAINRFIGQEKRRINKLKQNKSEKIQSIA
jgi:prophage antirepressor-like protein